MTPRKQAIRKKQTLSGARRRAFAVLTILFPFIFLALTELVLRELDYGPDLSLFRTERIGGREYYNVNPAVKGRYFSSVRFNPITSMDFFSRVKSPGTYRIFCLGGSTTAGYPYGYVGSFSTFLSQRLNRIFPDKQIEIINVGLTATNSFTTLDFAYDILDLEPDLVLVYDGHNEFYGALGVASNESVGRSRWLTRLYLGLVHFRTFLLLRDGYEGLRALVASGSSQDSGTMMERLARGQAVPYGSPLYRDALGMYRENVADLIDLCRSHDIAVMLGNQVSNLRDQPPFISAPGEIGDERKNKLNRLIGEGRSFLEEGKPDAAVPPLESSLAIDSSVAEARFLLASAYHDLNRNRDALRQYILARDYDQLRFRMSSDFNDATREIAASHGGVFVDLEGAFCRESPDSIVGNNLILEHLHPNVRGYFIMAREYAHAMRKNALLADSSEWAESDTISEDTLWEMRVLTDLDVRTAERRTAILTSGWPFRNTPRAPSTPDASDRIAMIIEDLLDGTVTWEQAHVEAAEYYEGSGQLQQAEKEYEAVLYMIPVNVSPYLRLARLFLKELKYEPAFLILNRSLSVEPTAYAYKALGAISVDTGNPDNAVTFLRRSVELAATPQEKTENGYLLALAYQRAGRADQAVRQLEEVLRETPSYQPAQRMLAMLRQGHRPPE